MNGMEDEYGEMAADLTRHYYYTEGHPFFPAPDSHRAGGPSFMFRSSDHHSTPSPTTESGRWPRQETLTLLHIRSRLDPMFREANHKAPLWDEVSRIMSEDNGYQRSGKKCREKFENLYKYYKKTKEGKSGRQDGKHYRFFRQLEAICGNNTTNPLSICNFPTSLPTEQEAYPGSDISLISAPDSCEYDTTTSSSYCSDSKAVLLDSSTNNNNHEDSREKKRRGKMRLIEESIDAQMKNMMAKQDAWMEKMRRAIESKEEERVKREEQWRRRDAERMERGLEMWGSERAWIDISLTEAFNKLVGKELEGEMWDRIINDQEKEG